VPKPPPHDTRQNGLYQHAIMARLAATEYNALVWLARKRGKALGTLVRDLLTDEVSTLLAQGTPLRQQYDRDRSSRRRNTPIERAARRPVAPTVQLTPAPTGEQLEAARAIHDQVHASTPPDEQTS